MDVTKQVQMAVCKWNPEYRLAGHLDKFKSLIWVEQPEQECWLII